MPQDPITAHCKACRAKFKVPQKAWGKSGKCPNCDAPMTFPAPEGHAGKSQKRVKCECAECGAPLILPASKAGKRIRCPKCGKQTKVDLAKITLTVKKPKGELDLAKEKRSKRQKPLQDGERKTRLAWEEMQREKEDSYWVALWRATLYPWHAFGALVFFVIGVPFTMVVSELLAKWALTWGGDFFAAEREHLLTYFALSVVGLAMAAVVSMFAFFASFLFAVIRTSAEGREAIPVIEGMHHRSNASALLSWAAVYFGPALAIGFKSAEGEAMFAWTPPVIGVLVVFMLLAPVGLLCSATVNAIEGINPVTVFKTIGAIFDRYAYMLLVLVLSAGIFMALGIWIGGKASLALGGESPDYVVGIPLRLLQGLFFMFPAVILARCLGLLVKYHRDDLPFEVDLYSEHKGSMAPQVLAAVGLVLLFLPIHKAGVVYASQGGVFLTCNRHLTEIYEKRLRYDIDRVRYPGDYEELEKIVGEGLLHCPAFPEEYPFYKIYPGLNQNIRKDAPKLIWIYESKPTHPEEDRRNVLLLDGNVKQMDTKKFEELLEIQERYLRAEDDDMREHQYKNYTGKLGLSGF